MSLWCAMMPPGFSPLINVSVGSLQAVPASERNFAARQGRMLVTCPQRRLTRGGPSNGELGLTSQAPWALEDSDPHPGSQVPCRAVLTHSDCSQCYSGRLQD